MARRPLLSAPDRGGASRIVETGHLLGVQLEKALLQVEVGGDEAEGGHSLLLRGSARPEALSPGSLAGAREGRFAPVLYLDRGLEQAVAKRWKSRS